MKKRGRLGLESWLKKNLNEETYPQQLWWINLEEQKFALRWTHASCASYDPKVDSKVFRAWAVHTENVKPEDDARVWKATFRCAMASVPSIEKIAKYPGTRSEPAIIVFKFLENSKSLKKKRKKNGKKGQGENETTNEAIEPFQYPKDYEEVAIAIEGYNNQDSDFSYPMITDEWMDMDFSSILSAFN